MRTWFRFQHFGVVPEEISAWKPETAPQAMVMKRNGNNAPEIQAGTVDKVGYGRHLQRRTYDEDTDGECDNRTDFQKVER